MPTRPNIAAPTPSRAAKAIQSVRDGLANFVTGLGTFEQDKAMSSFFQEILLTRAMLIGIYRFGGIGGKIVDCIADDCVREWRTITIPAGEDKKPIDLKPFEDLQSYLGVREAFGNAKRWARLFGGSVIFIDIEGDNPEEELIEDSVSQDKPVTGIRVVEKNDLSIPETSLATGRPLRYIDVTTNTTYHPSRVLGPFDGQILPRQELANNSGFGDSIFARVYNALLGEATTANQINSILHEAFVDVIGIKDLASFLDGGARQKILTDRWALAKFLKSSQHVTIFDSSNEEWQEHGTAAAIAAIAPVLEKQVNRIAAICDVPMTRLYGSLASGLTTSATTNMEDYHTKVAAEQTVFDKPLNVLDRLCCRSVYGMIPDGIYSEWLPLGEPSAKEKAETEKTRADTAEVYHRMGAIVPAHVVAAIAEEGPYDISSEYLGYVTERDGLLSTDGPNPDDTDTDNDLNVAPASGIQSGGEEDVQKQVLNGAQISSLVAIAKSIKIGEIDPEAGLDIIMLSIPGIKPESIAHIVSQAVNEKQPVPPQLQGQQGQNGNRPEEIGSGAVEGAPESEGS